EQVLIDCLEQTVFRYSVYVKRGKNEYNQTTTYYSDYEEDMWIRAAGFGGDSPTNHDEAVGGRLMQLANLDAGWKAKRLRAATDPMAGCRKLVECMVYGCVNVWGGHSITLVEDRLLSRLNTELIKKLLRP